MPISLCACHPIFSTSKAICKAQAKPSAKDTSFQLYANNLRWWISRTRTLPHLETCTCFMFSQLTQLACRSCKVPSCHERRTCRQYPLPHSPTNSHANQSSRVPSHVFHEQSHPQSTSKTICKGRQFPPFTQTIFDGGFHTFKHCRTLETGTCFTFSQLT